MKEQQHIFTNKMLRTLLIPVIFEQVLNSLMGTVDTMMVSNVGSAAISAVSLVDSINVLVIQAFSALAAGGAILCSQYIGQKNHEMANKSARQVLFIITAISVAVTALCLLFRVPLLKLIFGKVESDVMTASQVYFFYTALSFPFIALYDAGASIFRSQGNTCHRNSCIQSLLCCSGTLAASYGQTAYCSQKLQTDPSGWKNDQKSSGSGNPVRYREQHVSAWKAGNTVFRIYTGDGSHCSSGNDEYP